MPTTGGRRGSSGAGPLVPGGRFGAQEAERKAELLRCHRSQHERNLRVRGHGLDARILEVNRAIAAEAGLVEPFAEGFEVSLIG